MKIIVVRHTAVNVASGICYGQTEVETSSTFESEAHKILKKLQHENFRAVYSSPLTRCKKLAEIIAGSMPVQIDPRLKELNFGDWEMLDWKQISQTETAQQWFSNWTDVPCPEGESYFELIDRVKDFLSNLQNKHPQENILIVTHSGVIRAFISLLNRVDPKKVFDVKIDFGSIHKFSMNE